VLQQQHRNAAATRAAETVSQRSCIACYSSAAALPRLELQQRELTSLQLHVARPSPQRYVARRCSATPLPAIAAAAAKLCTSDVNQISVGHSTSIRRWTSVLPSCRPAPCRFDVLHPVVLRLVVLRPTPYVLTSYVLFLPPAFRTMHCILQIIHCVRIL